MPEETQADAPDVSRAVVQLAKAARLILVEVIQRGIDPEDLLRALSLLEAH